MKVATRRERMQAIMNPTRYAIYQHHDDHDDVVLLTDGAWTHLTNCCRSENGYILSQPKLFDTLADAQAYKRARVGSAPRYTADQYTGQTLS